MRIQKTCCRFAVASSLAVSLATSACSGGASSTPATGSDASSTTDDGAPLGDAAPIDAGPVDAGPPGAMSVWTAGIGPKIQPTTAAGTATTIAVSTTRAAWASAQLVVRGQGGSLSGVTAIVAADLSDGAGHTIAKSEVTLFREAFIDFTSVTANTGNVPAPKSSPTSDGKVPDPLIPLVDPYSGANAGQPFDVASSTNQPIFVDVHAPKGTTAGTYTGSIHVAATTGGAVDVPLAVTVWDLDLPDMTTVTTQFKMSVNDIIQFHKNTSACSGGSCYLSESPYCDEIVKRYEELAHDHRIDTGQPLAELPVDACNVPTDWTAYDAAMAPYLSGTYFADGVPSSRIDSPFNPGQNYGIDGTCTQAQYTAISAAWATHLKAKGWFEKIVVYAYDEPPASAFAGIAQDSSWLQAGDPDWKAHVMDTTSPNATSAPILNPALGIYTVNLPEYDAWNGNAFYGRAQWPGLMSQGIRLWFYESNSVTPPYPTFASDTLDGLEPVMAMWGSWYERATGFLYWDIAAWDDKDSWGPEITYGLTGDGVLIYPGNHDGLMAPAGSPSDVAIDGPVPSYRLKLVRNGLQDWALFALADRKGLTTYVQGEVSKVYTQLGGCTWSGCPASPTGWFWKTNEGAMDAIRSDVVAKILATP